MIRACFIGFSFIGDFFLIIVLNFSWEENTKKEVPSDLLDTSSSLFH